MTGFVFSLVRSPVYQAEALLGVNINNGVSESLPLWLTSVLGGYSAFTKRKTRFSIELLLLLWGTAILFLSQSRIGLLSAMAIVGVLILSVGWQQTGRLTRSIRGRRVGNQNEVKQDGPDFLRIALWSLFVLVLLLAVFQGAGLGKLVLGICPITPA